MVGCAEERPARSVTELIENPIMLEAAMVSCAQDRAATRYEAECVNARRAVEMIEAKEEAARKADREARSESKRQALRRTQEAATQARLRAEEAERLRKEAEYLAQFGIAMPPEEPATDDEQDFGNLPAAVIPDNSDLPLTSADTGDVVPATDGGNAPIVAEQPEDDD
jgi:hypothetical protein